MISYLYLYDFEFFQWVVKGAVDVDIGANPSAEGGGNEEGLDDQAVKVATLLTPSVYRLLPLFLFQLIHCHHVFIR
jgi:hypothetical protein